MASEDLNILKQCLCFMEDKFFGDFCLSESQMLHVKRVYRAAGELVRTAERAVQLSDSVNDIRSTLSNISSS